MFIRDGFTINIINDTSRSVNDASKSTLDDYSDTPNCGITSAIDMMVVICLWYRSQDSQFKICLVMP